MPKTCALSKLQAWRHQNYRAVDSWLRLLAELESQDQPDLAMLSVALGAVQRLAASAVRGQAETGRIGDRASSGLGWTDPQ
jgi:hypothetical protein